MSGDKTNWIPTNWPAQTVHCFVCFTNSATTNIVALPDWVPPEPLTLNLYVYKTADGQGILQTATGTSIVTVTGASSSFSKCALNFIPNIGWCVIRNTVSQPIFVVGSTRLYPLVSGLPEDGTFAPVILEE